VITVKGALLGGVLQEYALPDNYTVDQLGGVAGWYSIDHYVIGGRKVLSTAVLYGGECVYAVPIGKIDSVDKLVGVESIICNTHAHILRLIGEGHTGTFPGILEAPLPITATIYNTGSRGYEGEAVSFKIDGKEYVGTCYRRERPGTRDTVLDWFDKAIDRSSYPIDRYFTPNKVAWEELVAEGIICVAMFGRVNVGLTYKGHLFSVPPDPTGEGSETLYCLGEV
jgi:hypothetical protein